MDFQYSFIMFSFHLQARAVEIARLLLLSVWISEIAIAQITRARDHKITKSQKYQNLKIAKLQKKTNLKSNQPEFRSHASNTYY